MRTGEPLLRAWFAASWQRWSGATLIVMAMTMWAVTEAAAGVLLRRTPVVQIVWIRYFFHLVLMLAVFGVPSRFAFLGTGRPWLQFGRSQLMLTMPLAFAVAAPSSRTQAVLSLFWTAPVLWLALGSLAGERAPRIVWLAALVGWGGTALFYEPFSPPPSWITVAGGLVMAVSFSAYLVLTRILDRTESVLTNLFYSGLGVFVVLSLAMPFFWTPMSARVIAGGAIVAITGWVALYLLEVALRGEMASMLAPLLFAEVLFDATFRMIDRGRWPAASAVLGTALLAVSVATALWSIRRRQAVPPDSRLHA